MSNKTVILGAGMTGIAAGVASRAPVYESNMAPGGICSSYYIRSDENERHFQQPRDQEAYRFEVGGGHWIFGGDNHVFRFINRFAMSKQYARRSSVYFCNSNLYIPYPLQNHLRFLGNKIARRALSEMSESKGPCGTLKEWLERCFGPTLCDLFFFPFHELYTAGLYHHIAPQDAYKSPVDLKLVEKGALEDVSQVGYNISFMYPEEGLDSLAHRMAAQSDVQYNKTVTKIDPHGKILYFDDDSCINYSRLISTLPLNRVAEMSGLEISAKADPYTSVLVLNIGAVRGNRCPDDHWLYIPDSNSGFHRVGFYSNVDRSFLPASVRNAGNRVSIYVERAFAPHNKPSPQEISAYSDRVLTELQELGFIGDPEVVDNTWVDIAYTWSWPASSWRDSTLRALKRHHIDQIGRYGTWTFKGIADSIHDGLKAGTAVEKKKPHSSFV